MAYLKMREMPSRVNKHDQIKSEIAAAFSLMR
jgi:hypothetical protein